MAEPADELMQLFDEALALPAADRAEFLAVRCAGRAELLAELESLLAHADTAGDFLEQPPAAVAALGQETPAEVGPYRLVAKLGEGGFGEVWRAEQQQPIARTVALKLIRREVGSAAARQRFAAERQALALLEHPGIARIHDAGTTADGRPWYAMELVDGPAITEWCRLERTGLADRVRLIVQVCRALHHAHERGIVHRDLKPSNVLVAEIDGKPQPKIIDFGIAKLGESELDTAWRTQDGQVVGTPAYMSPEQARGEVLAVDARTDVHAIGVVLFELLTGTLPFEPRGALAKDLVALHRRIAEDEAPRPSSRISERSSETDYRPPVLPRAVRGDLDWIVLKALAKERERRYPSTLALAEDLDSFLRDRPVLASPPSRVYRLRKWFLRHRAAAVAGLLAVALGAAGVFGTLSWMRRAEQLELANRESNARTAAAAAAEQALQQKLDAVVAFLCEVVTAADPEHAIAREFSVRDVVDAVARELPPDLPPAPAARLRLALGKTYHGLGRLDEAEPHLRQALAAADRAGGDLRGPVRLELGLLCRDTGRGDEALQLLQEGLRLAEGSGDALQLAVAIDALGLLHGTGGDRKAAEAEHRRALELLPPSAPPAIATAMRQHLAEALESLGEYAEAERTFDEARARALELGDRGLPLLLQIDSSRLHLLLRQAQPERALQLAHGCCELATRIYGEDHFETGFHRTSYGQVLQQNGKLAEAEAELRAGIELLRKHRPEGSISESRALLSLGWTLTMQKQNEAAELAMRDGLQLQKRLLGADHPDVAVGLRDLSRVLRQRHAYAEAEQNCREALRICRQKNGERHISVAITLHALALALLSQDKDQEAAQCLEQAVQIATPLLAADHEHLAEFRLRLGHALALLGRYADARPWFELAFQGRAGKHGEADRFAVQAAKNLIKLGIDTADFDLVDRWRQRLPLGERDFARELEAQRRQQAGR